MSWQHADLSMRTLARRSDAVLRAEPWAVQGAGNRSAVWWLATIVVVFGMVYGAVMGTYGGVSGERLLHVLYASLKVPMLLLVTGALSLPCFFVLYTLMGIRHEFLPAVRALLAGQAGLAVILASLSPFTALWYLSTTDYNNAILFNGLMFAIASFTAQFLVRCYYRPLVKREPKHRVLLRAWLLIYIFVGIQMGWVLRPFIGNPASPVQFFRSDSWGNAYEVVSHLIWQALSGR